MQMAMGGSMPHVEPATSTRTTDDEVLLRTPSSTYDWERLDRAVRTLVAQHEALRGELGSLRADLGARNQRIRALEAQLLDANQRRQDTSKRIDELIAQLDQLDAQLASAEPEE
jgi:chromosome segregation ATPase